MTLNLRRCTGLGLVLFSSSLMAGSISASRPTAANFSTFPHAISVTATLVTSGTGLAYFGQDVAAEGGVVAVGAPYVLVPGVRRRGAVYVYERPSGGWIEEPAESAILVTSLSFPQSGQFGAAIDMSGDVIVVGEPYVIRNQEGNRAYSRAFVYVKPPTGWSGVIPEEENYTGAGVVFVKPTSGGWGRGNVTASAVLSGGFGAQAARLNAMDIRGDTVAMSGVNFQSFTAIFVRPPGGWVDASPDAQLTGTSLRWPIAVASSSTVLATGGRITGNRLTVSAFRRPTAGWSGEVGPTQRILVGGVDRVASIAVDGRTAVIGALGSTFFDNVGRVFIAELSNDPS
jgi:hypothetical protein